MRLFAATLLTLSLAASPLLAKNANETGKEETPAAVSSASAVPDKPTPAVKPEASAIETEMQDLRSLVEEQRAELEAQRAALKAEQLKMEALEEKLGAPASEPSATPTPTPDPASIISSKPTSTPVSATGASESGPSTTWTALGGTPGGLPPQKPSEQGQESPLFFKIGGAEFYPLGFMDATNTFRTTNMTTQGGGSIGTSFGSIPFSNTVLGQNTEDKFSAQNSRIGLRTHAVLGKVDVTGYLEADFLGYLAPSGNVTSNSDSLRLRLYWVNAKVGKFEFQAGQSWSLLTPNRNGLSALPGDLFYGQEMDTNYYLGLTYTRAAGFRVIAHPTKNWAIGVSLENPQQLLPSTITLPATVPSQFNVATTQTVNGIAVINSAPNIYGNQFDTNSGNTSSTNGVNNTSIPNMVPDVIVKTAFDAVPGGHHVHFDLAGILRTFRAVNLVQSTFASPTSTTITTPVYTTAQGGGIAGTANIELVKNLRFIATGFWSDGGGRYIGNTAGPDLIIRADGTISPIHSGSGLGGFEYQVTPKWMLYGYYSGTYFGKDVTAANANGTGFAGYGFPGSNNSSDRYLYEPEFGFVHVLWGNPRYGDIKVITQYAYVSRTPWNVPAATLATAHTSIAYIDLRYDLP